MNTTDQILHNWLLGFNGHVSACEPYSDRLYFKMEMWFNRQPEKRQLIIAKSLALRRKKLRAQGVRPAAQQAIGELWVAVVNS
jgi:hypothetical protein